MAIQPSNVSLLIGESQQFAATGGSAPYTFSVSSGQGSVSSTGIYTTPSATGNTVVQATDSDGKIAYATITISLPVAVAPQSATVGTSQTQIFTASGGVPPYTYSLATGSGSIDSSGTYTAPGTSGAAVVQIEDSAGNSAYASVSINPLLSISPTTSTLGYSENLTFTASGGVLPYTFSIAVGGGSIDSVTGIYTSPNSVSTVYVKVTDNAGSEAITGAISIVDKPQISPDNSEVGTNLNLTFTASAGTPPYSYSIVSGGGSIVAGTGVYTAPATAGSAIIRVTDSSVPTPLTDETTLTIFAPKEISAGAYQSCVVSPNSTGTDSTLKCFGLTGPNNTEIGLTGPYSPTYIGDDSSELGDNLSAVNLGTGVTALKVSTSHYFTCAVLSDYRMKCWGYNANGSLLKGAGGSEGYYDGSMGDSLPYLSLGTGRTVNNVLPINDVIAMRYYNACVILDDNSLKCWGRGNYGQNGLGNTTTYGDAASEVGDSLPAVNLGANTPLQVAVGYEHACVLLNNNTVKCWGRNVYGELGYEDTTQRGHDGATTPNLLSAVDLGTGRTASQICTGNSFSCALLDDSSVKCWGRNNYGQLGQGSTTSLGDGALEMGDNLLAIDLGTGRTANEISCGIESACARLDNNTMKCWGRGTYGEHGAGSTVNIGDAPGEMGDTLQAIDLGTGRTPTSLYGGYYQNCAILDDGSTKCWGYNGRAQLFLGHLFDVGKSALSMGDNLSAINVGTGRTILNIDMGTYHTCATLDNNTVKCWGQDFYGARGDEAYLVGDESSDMGANLSEIDAPTGEYFVDVKSFRYNFCGKTNSNNLYCWGDNNSGGLGVGNNQPQGWDTDSTGDNFALTNLGTGRTVKNYCVGNRYGCAILDDDSLKCWGEGAQGRRGSGDTADRGDGGGEMGDSLATVDLGVGNTPQSLSCGNNTSCAVMTTGQLKCWGESGRGQLGQENTADRGDGGGEMGAALAFTDLGTGRTAQKTCNGNEFTCALLDNNSVKCWGRNNYGQLGQENNTDLGDGGGEMGDNLSAINLGTGRTATDIGCGLEHACAILDDGSLKCWGRGNNGQLGNGSTATIGDGINEMGDNLTPINLGSGRTAVRIEPGYYHTCAVLDNNDVKCWGDNLYGQLGQGHIIDIGTLGITMGDSLSPIDLD